jgi:hypothetical protein
MMHPEQERIFDRARLRRKRVAGLRHQRAVAELQLLIAFESMWTDPCRSAAYGAQDEISTEQHARGPLAGVQDRSLPNVLLSRNTRQRCERVSLDQFGQGADVWPP